MNLMKKSLQPILFLTMLTLCCFHVVWSRASAQQFLEAEILPEQSMEAADLFGNNETKNQLFQPDISKIITTIVDTVNYNLVCVDSVWYDPGNKTLINVRVFNGDVNNLNYPSVQIVSPTNDTVGNPNNFVNFFAQLGNTFTVYTDTITDSTITNFSNYTFLINEGFGDTTAVIQWCGTVGITESANESLIIFPNPAKEFLTIEVPFQNKNTRIIIYNLKGEEVFNKILSGEFSERIDLSHISSGVYLIHLVDHLHSIKSRVLKL